MQNIQNQFASENNESYLDNSMNQITNDDLYDESVDFTYIKYPTPENLDMERKRSDTNKIEQTCSIIRNNVMKLSQNRSQSRGNPIKKLVSKKKNRFNYDGFNLDLTCIYITDQIIAMGYPATDFEQLFRNSMQDVQRFFNTRHNNHYKIVNLYQFKTLSFFQRCSERKYQHSYFGGMVSEFPFDDHQAPPFTMIYELCQELYEWLTKDKRNVAAIHCKAGKGRTGVMICCYLLYSNMFDNSYDAMRYYGTMRTNDKKGLTIPSQIRYVMYYEKATRNKWTIDTLPQRAIRLLSIRLVTIPRFNSKGLCEPWFIIKNKDLSYSDEYKKVITSQNAFIEFELDLEVKGDVQISFFHKSLMNKKTKMFQFWFNTIFFDTYNKMIIDKFMLDGAHKDYDDKKFSRNFRVEIDGIDVDQNNVMYNSSFLSPDKIEEITKK